MGLALYLMDWPTIVLQYFDTVGWVIWPVKIVPDTTYNVFGGTLNSTLLLLFVCVYTDGCILSVLCTCPVLHSVTLTSWTESRCLRCYTLNGVQRYHHFVAFSTITTWRARFSSVKFWRCLSNSDSDADACITRTTHTEIFLCTYAVASDNRESQKPWFSSNTVISVICAKCRDFFVFS